ncbi:MAG TPA: prepilin peptidase [Pyrinomonadaceae bacterium]|jgi:leader peptidase (prepilin peptidase)/N-methyltransferase
MLKGGLSVKDEDKQITCRLRVNDKRMSLHLILFLFETALALPTPLVFPFVFALGAIIGSFLNVVIHRLPREESIVFPNSRCPSCAVAIHFYDNIPVFSYLILRGRCRSCQSPISKRYPAVEALTGLLYGAVYLHDGLTPALGFNLLFVTALIALVFIDAEHMILPNAITYPGLVFALAARVLLPYLTGESYFEDLAMMQRVLPPSWPMWAVSLAGALLGALVGGGSLWLVGWIWERVRGVEAMGLGDVKMMFMVGAYFGWRLTILTIFIAMFLGALIGIALVLWQTYQEVGSISKVLKMAFGRQLDLQIQLPFGIFLGAASIIALFIGRAIVAWYAAKF